MAINVMPLQDQLLIIIQNQVLKISLVYLDQVDESQEYYLLSMKFELDIENYS